MKPLTPLRLLPLILFGIVLCGCPTSAAVKLGTGNAGLLGGDLTDPTDSAKNKPGVNYGEGKSEDEMRPEGGAWVSMKMTPFSPPGSPPHQTHAYQSWQGAPACKLFLNNPEKEKWYVSFREGGRGGPTREAPYSVAVQLKTPVFLTHFTITTDRSERVADRDPKAWSIQGSLTGKDGEWTDIYKCEATDRASSPLADFPRNETTLFTTFTGTNATSLLDAANLGKLRAKLKDQKLEKADFALSAKAYSWFRLVIYSCFNPNGTDIPDPSRPPGCALSQLELFGVPSLSPATRAAFPPPASQVKPATLPKPPASALPFIITYWCGPPKAETTLERYKEIAEAGFNVAFPAVDALWAPGGPEIEEHNRKYLDLCGQVGLKALVWDGSMPRGNNWKAHTPAEIPQIEKTLDGIIARYSAHPALLGYVVCDEPTTDLFPRLGLVNQYLLKKDPRHLPYLNLFPAYAFNPRSIYADHVTKYLATVKPALVTWSHFRQMTAGGEEGTYWSNLELVRKSCVEAGIPYNQTIVSLKHMDYRECSEADLRWQVYTSLAFGSRGITYFTYWNVKALAAPDAPAIMTLDGRRDKKYEYVKKINQRIAALGPTLVKLVCTGAYFGDSVPLGGEALPDYAPVKKMEGGRLLVGCFVDSAGKQCIFPVNLSFTNKVTAKLTLDPKVVSLAEFSQETGKPVASALLPGGTLEVSLEPGEGKLFLLGEK